MSHGNGVQRPHIGVGQKWGRPVGACLRLVVTDGSRPNLASVWVPHKSNDRGEPKTIALGKGARRGAARARQTETTRGACVTDEHSGTTAGRHVHALRGRPAEPFDLSARFNHARITHTRSTHNKGKGGEEGGGEEGQRKQVTEASSCVSLPPPRFPQRSVACVCIVDRTSCARRRTCMWQSDHTSTDTEDRQPHPATHPDHTDTNRQHQHTGPTRCASAACSAGAPWAQ